MYAILFAIPVLYIFPSTDAWEVEQNNWTQTLDVLKHTQETTSVKYTSSSSKNNPQVRLLCGADLLESFAVPGLWKEEHVGLSKITLFQL